MFSSAIVALFATVSARFDVVNCEQGMCGIGEYVGTWKVVPTGFTSVCGTSLMYAVGQPYPQGKQVQVQFVEICRVGGANLIGTLFNNAKINTFSLPVGEPSFGLTFKRLWRKDGIVVAASVSQPLITDYDERKTKNQKAIRVNTLWYKPAIQFSQSELNQIQREA